MRNDIDQTRVNADQLLALVPIITKAKLVPMVTSSPGVGKSALFSLIAKRHNLQLLDVRLSTADPTTIGGLPFLVDGQAKMVPFNEMFPTDDMELPEGKAGWLLFLDELTSANRAVQAACYQVILDKMVGMRKLHPRVIIAAAGNNADDRAIVNHLSTALQSRMIHLSLIPDVDVWTKNVAIPKKYDFRITSFINAYPNYLMQFDPEHEEKTFAAPRTWAFLNSILKEAKNIPINDLAPAIAGTVSGSVGAKFIAFCENMHEVTSLEDVLRDPETARIPDQNQYKWATVLSLSQNLTRKNISLIYQYIERMNLPMKIIFCRNMILYNNDLTDTPEFTKAVQTIGEQSS